MGAPVDDVAEIRASQGRLQMAIADLDDVAVRAPSQLPEWTVGHVLTHIARNADSVVRRLDGAVRGDSVTQYAGGVDGRAAEINGGANRSAIELIADVRDSGARLLETLDSVPDDVWDGSVLDLNGRAMPTTMMAFIRWREVEVHHVDLGLGYTIGDWPVSLVQRWLPLLVDDLTDRAEDRALMAWLIGRGAAPQLGGWG